MSYFICTTAKYKHEDLQGIEKENERLDGYCPADGHIDPARASLNYHTATPLASSYAAAVDARVATLNLQKTVRKDAVYMVSLVISASDSFFDTMTSYEQKDFFEDCTKSLTEMFGEANVVSAVVHLDESKPHLHFNFVPVIDGRLSAHEVMQGDSFDSFLKKVYEATGKKWGLEMGDVSSGIKKTTMAKYKAREEIDKAAKVLDQVNEKAKAQEEEMYERQKQVASLRIEEKKLRKQVSELTGQRDRLNIDVTKLQYAKADIETEQSAKIPLRRRKDQIQGLRLENLHERNLLRDKEEDYDFLYTMYKGLQMRLQEEDEYAKMAKECVDKYPNEFRDLYERAKMTKKTIKENRPRNRDDRDRD